MKCTMCNRVFQLCVLAAAVFVFCGSTTAVSWYRGCHSKPPRISFGTPSNASDLVSAAATCYHNRFHYLFMAADNYTCMPRFVSLTVPSDNSLCDIPCAPPAIVPCGSTSHGYFSLYLADGPYLTHVTTKVDANYVVVNAPVMLMAVARIAAYRNITNDGNHTDRGLRFMFHWSVDGVALSPVTVDADSDVIISRMTHTFSSTAPHRLEVRVENLISEMTSQPVTVVPILPKPISLELSISGDYQPSCIPHESSIHPTLRTVAVYVNETTNVTASLAVSVNVTFVISFGDTGDVVTRKPESEGCVGLDCTLVTEKYTFERTGEFVISVTATNEYGSEQKNITVMVVSHVISNLTIQRIQSDALFVARHTNIEFLITIETASRKETFLDVSFSVDRHYLYAVCGDNMTHDHSSLPDHIKLVHDYGIGCVLKIDVKHYFDSVGKFQPLSVAYNGVSNVTAACPEFTVIDELKSPSLVVNDAVEVDKAVFLFLKLTQKSDDFDIVWMFRSLVDNFTVQTKTQGVNVSFSHVGDYKVHVNASNPISYVTTDTTITVQSVVKNAQINCVGGKYVPLHKYQICSAAVGSGSHVTFKWNFGDRTAITNNGTLKSTINHSFLKSGVYNVSVNAFNKVSSNIVYLLYKIHVQEAIHRVIVKSNSPVLVNQTIKFQISVKSGSEVMVMLHLGSSRYPAVFSTSDNKYHCDLPTINPGVYNITVYASNNVSSKSELVPIVVEDDIAWFSVAVMGESVANQTTVIVVTSDVPANSLITMTVTQGDTSDVVTNHAVSRIVTHMFTHTGTYNVTFTLFNLVTSHATTLQLEVIDTPTQPITINHPVYAELLTPVNFSLESVGSIAWASVRYDRDPPTFLDLTSPFTWTHTFTTAGSHWLTVSGISDGNASSVDTVVVVERPLTNVHISGPSLVPVYRPGHHEVWLAHIGSNVSGVTYEWRWRDEDAITTAYPMFTRVIDRRQNHNLTLIARNRVSSAQTSVMVTSQWPLNHTDQLTVNTVSHGTPSSIDGYIHGGTDFTVMIDYGDGERREYRPDGDVISVARPGTSDIPPVHNFLDDHLYKHFGHHTINITIVDSISRLVNILVAKVEEPISGVVVTTRYHSVIPLTGNTTVVMRATVATGTDLVFKWHFEPEGLHREENSRRISDRIHEAWFTYNSAGTYHVNVSVSNEVSTTQTAKAPYPFKVVKTIRGPKLSADHATFRGVVSDPVVFTASCADCSHTTFIFHFGDGMTKSIEGTSVCAFKECKMQPMEAVMRHVYRSVATYSTSVTISNPLGQVSASRNVSIQVPVSGVKWVVQPAMTLLGNVSVFTLSVDHGTDVIGVEWNMGDETTNFTYGTPHTFSHTYRERGVFYVTAKVYNLVSHAYTRTNVTVWRKIQSAHIICLNPRDTLDNSSNVVAEGDRVKFIVQVVPNDTTPIKQYNYAWHIDGKEENILRDMQHTFPTHGLFYITVNISNHVKTSYLNSPPFLLRVVAPIKTLTIKFETDQPIKNVPFYMSIKTDKHDISDYTMTWDFGDGTPLVTSNRDNISHVFNSIGAYTVKVNGINPLSSANASMLVFVNTVLCKKPDITFYPMISVGDTLKIYKSSVLYLDVKVVVECSLATGNTYLWSITNATNTTHTITPTHPDGTPVALTYSTLYVPALTLDYGNYTISLRVSLDNTIVHDTKTMDLVVSPTPLVAVMREGISMRVGRDQIVTLDGSRSYDPDDLGSSDLIYKWGCYKYKSKSTEGDCWDDTSSDAPPLNTSMLSFNASFFNETDKVLVNLTVSKPGRNNSTIIDNFVTIVTDKHISTRIECPKCGNGLVNTDDALSFHVVTDLHPDATNIEYSWRVEKVTSQNIVETPDCTRVTTEKPKAGSMTGEKTPTTTTTSIGQESDSMKTLSTRHPRSTSLPSDTATAPHVPINDNTTHPHSSNTTAKPHHLRKTDEPGPTKPPPGDVHTTNTPTHPPPVPIPGGVKESRDHDQSTSNGDRRRRGGDNKNAGPISSDGSQRGFPSESRTGSRKRGQSHSKSSSEKDSNTGNSEKSPAGGFPFPNGISQGGTGSGRDSNKNTEGSALSDPEIENTASTTIPYGTSNWTTVTAATRPTPPDGGGDGKPDPGDEVGKPEKTILIPTIKLVAVSIAESSLIGTADQTLIIPAGTLKSGSSYIVTVTIDDMQNGTEYMSGTAGVFVRVNKNPFRGHCSSTPELRPTFEMLGEIKIYCEDYRDDDPTYKTVQGEVGAQYLMYETSYTLTPNTEPQLLYRGLKPKHYIYLPAGSKQDNNTVVIHVSVLDGKGGKTKVCDMYEKVYPQEPKTREDHLIRNDHVQAILSDWTRHWALLTKFASDGDIYHTRVFVGYLADKLNDVSSHENRTSRSILRQRLVGYLHDLPIDDQFDAFQTLQVLPRVTRYSHELSLPWLEKSAMLLHSVITLLTHTDIEGTQYNTTLAQVVPVSSDILKAAAQYDQQYERPMVAAITNTVNNILTRFLTKSAIPRTIHTDFMSLYTSQFSPSHYRTQHTLNSTVITLPRDMTVVMAANNLTRRPSIDLDAPYALDARYDQTIPQNTQPSDCFRLEFINYAQNPVPFIHNKPIHSEVTSLSLYDCQGGPIKVTDLADDNRVSIGIANKLHEEKKTHCNHTLHRHSMSVHSFNFSADSVKQMVHLEVNLDRVPPFKKPFNISLLIRCGTHHPTPTDHNLRYDYSGHIPTISLIFEPGTFPAGECHLGLVHTQFNAGRVRKDHLDLRIYNLSLWSVECVYWHTGLDKWSSHGCIAMPDSTINYTKCECNHMTTFASHIELMRSEVKFVPADSFFIPGINRVTIVVVSIVMVTYIICLVVCVVMESRDDTTAGPVYLTETMACDSHKFEITVITGFQHDAGTTARVSIILHGDDGISETRELYSPDRLTLFDRNSSCVFVTSFGESIGKVSKIQVWHNNTGASPGWRLSRVIVKDLSTEEEYYFLCERWLAVEKGDGKIEREFAVVDGNLGFTKVFWAKVCQYANYLHSWGSFFTCPTHSHYSHAQRLTVCLVALAVYMCLNALWYHTQHTEYRGEFVLMDVSCTACIVGIVSSLITLPLILILSSLFRASNGHSTSLSKEKKTKAKPTEETSEEIRAEHVQPIMTHSILDQSLLNWQSIQEWAQKQWIKRQQAYVVDEAPPYIEAVKFTPPAPTPWTECSSGFEDSSSTEPHHPHHPSCKRCQAKHPTVTPRVSCCVLPYWFHYVTWFLCFAIAAAAVAMTIYVGYRFGVTKSTLWLQSVFFSFISTVFIVEPILIQLCTSLIAICYRNDPSILNDHDNRFYGDDVTVAQSPTDPEGNQCCKECEELEKGVAARQRSRYLRFARPPHEKQLIQARQATMKEKKALAIVIDWVSYIGLLGILAVIAFGKSNGSAYLLQKDLRQTFMSSNSMGLNQVRTFGDWYTWSRTSLLDGLFQHLAYDRHSPTSEQNRNNLIVGRVQLRQLRVRPTHCHPAITSYFPNQTVCRPQYAKSAAETFPYGEYSTIWIHRDLPQNYEVYGYHGDYDNTGYSLLLSNNRAEAYKQLTSLETQHWTDSNTRLIIVEFTLYSAPSNLFTSVALLAESPPTGSLFPSVSVSSTFLYRYVSVWDQVLLAVELLFMVVVLYKVDIAFFGLMKHRLQYLTDAWNVLEVLLCLVSLAYLGCYIYRFSIVYNTKEYLLQTYPDEFVDVSRLSHWDQVITAEVALIMAIVMCQSLYLLRYRKTFANLGSIYKHSYRQLAVFVALFVVSTLAYATLGTAIFGAYSYNYRAVWTSIDSIVGLLVRQYHVTDMDDTIGARVYIASYLVIVSTLLTAYMFAVLSHQYKSHRRHGTLTMGYLEMVKFIWGRFLNMTRIKKPDLPEPEETVLPAEFTMSEIENQVDELLFRMNAISGTHGLPDKPICYFSDSDSTFALADDGISSAGSVRDQTTPSTTLTFLDQYASFDVDGEDPTQYPTPHRGGPLLFMWHIKDQHPSFDVENMEERIQRIEEDLLNKNDLGDLLSNEPISDDVEKQLRSELETEIFRQLQLQRAAAELCPSSTSSSVESPLTEVGDMDTPERESRFTYKLPPLVDYQYGSTPTVTTNDLLAQLSSESDPYESGEPFPEDLIMEALCQLQLPSAATPTKSASSHDSSPGGKKAKKLLDEDVFGEEAALPFDSGDNRDNSAPVVVFHRADGSVESYYPGNSTTSVDLPPIETPPNTIKDSSKNPDKIMVSAITHTPLGECLSSSTQESSSGSENDAYLRRWAINSDPIPEIIIHAKPQTTQHRPKSPQPSTSGLSKAFSSSSEVGYMSALAPSINSETSFITGYSPDDEIKSDSVYQTPRSGSNSENDRLGRGVSSAPPRVSLTRQTQLSRKLPPGSSSSSEQDGIRCQKPPSKKGNLRKTKSRGKGKDAKSSPLEVLDDFAVDSMDSTDQGAGCSKQAWK